MQYDYLEAWIKGLITEKELERLAPEVIDYIRDDHLKAEEV